MLKSVTNLNKEKFSINSILLINLVLAFFPISLILGSFIVNVNLILFCALGIFHLRSKILTTKLNLPIKIIFLLFFVIFFSTSLSFIKSLYFEGYEYIHLARLMKSIIFFRFFLLLVIVYLLSEHSILNFKYFFISAAFSSLLVALDVIYQYIFGFNIIGLKSFVHSNTGFFGDELVAGGFIQNFSFFSTFFVVFIFKNKKNLRFILTLIAICILGVGIIFSGNRMPLISFLFGLLLIPLFNNKLIKIIPVALICFLIIFKFIYSSNPLVHTNYKSFFQNIMGLMIPEHTLSKNKEINHAVEGSSTLIKEKERFTFPFPNYSQMNPHTRLFYTALDTWKRNKIFGNGIKSFRIDCDKLRGSAIYPELGYNIGEDLMLFKKNRLCSGHPHNYYLEILTETGIVGFFITLTIALLFVVFILKNFKLFKENNIENIILLSATISLILEVFPFQSTGSVFTTNNTTYIVLISSIILSYKKRQISSNG